MDRDTRDYFERRAGEEATRARKSPTRGAATAHRELEQLYRLRLPGGSEQLSIVTEDQQRAPARKLDDEEFIAA